MTSSNCRNITENAYHGVVVVNKPSGMTSHDVVNRARRIFEMKRVGHAGTLDPIATGVLALCLGHATRIAEYLASSGKVYIAEALFGVETNTQDISGDVLETRDASGLSASKVEETLTAFRGDILQIPPMVSAVHHQGRRLYELAREGVEVERSPRPVTIHELKLLEFHPGNPARARLRIACSSGTYIRTICADVGRELGVGGMMESLMRTRAGCFSIDEAHTLEELQSAAGNQQLQSYVIPIEQAMANWKKATLDANDLQRLIYGLPLSPVDYISEGEEALLLDVEGKAAGLARMEDNYLKPFKVFLSHANA
jgi:tRNA pseudouridine55 synthase